MAMAMRAISADIVSKETLTPIDNLPERERLAVTLRYIEGLSFQEIGQVLGVTEFQATQLHDQAVTMLRPHLTSESAMLDEASLDEGRASAWGSLSSRIRKAVQP